MGSSVELVSGWQAGMVLEVEGGDDGTDVNIVGLHTKKWLKE
jgi:hypothetical protein